MTCKIDGAVSNKMIDKTTSKDWQLFTSSLRSFSGNLHSVITAHGEPVSFERAFPPLDSEARRTAGGQDAGYDETVTVNELVKGVRSLTTNDSP